MLLCSYSFIIHFLARVMEKKRKKSMNWREGVGGEMYYMVESLVLS